MWWDHSWTSDKERRRQDSLPEFEKWGIGSGWVVDGIVPFCLLSVMCVKADRNLWSSLLLCQQSGNIRPVCTSWTSVQQATHTGTVYNGFPIDFHRKTFLCLSCWKEAVLQADIHQLPKHSHACVLVRQATQYHIAPSVDCDMYTCITKKTCTTDIFHKKHNTVPAPLPSLTLCRFGGGRFFRYLQVEEQSSVQVHANSLQPAPWKWKSARVLFYQQNLGQFWECHFLTNLK